MRKLLFTLAFFCIVVNYAFTKAQSTTYIHVPDFSLLSAEVAMEDGNYFKAFEILENYFATTKETGAAGDDYSKAKKLYDDVLDKGLLNAEPTTTVAQIKALIAAGGKVNARDSDGETPLHRAAEEGYTERIKILIDADANMSAKEKKHGYIPLHYAAKTGHADAVRTLVDAGSYVDTKNANGYTPLYNAVWIGHSEIVEELVKKGADVNLRDKHKATPLHYAALDGYTEVVRKLLEGRSGINARDKNKATPLHYAASRGKADVVSELIKNKTIDINAKHVLGWTPLCEAVKKGHSETAEILKRAGGVGCNSG